MDMIFTSIYAVWTLVLKFLDAIYDFFERTPNWILLNFNDTRRGTYELRRRNQLTLDNEELVDPYELIANNDEASSVELREEYRRMHIAR